LLLSPLGGGAGQIASKGLPLERHVRSEGEFKRAF